MDTPRFLVANLFLVRKESAACHGTRKGPLRIATVDVAGGNT